MKTAIILLFITPAMEIGGNCVEVMVADNRSVVFCGNPLKPSGVTPCKSFSHYRAEHHEMQSVTKHHRFDLELDCHADKQPPPPRGKLGKQK